MTQTQYTCALLLTCRVKLYPQKKKNSLTFSMHITGSFKPEIAKDKKILV